MNKDSKIYVAGHKGLVGSAIYKKLVATGYTNIVTRTHQELDLIDQKAVNDFFVREKPDYVFLSAGKVGGIIANSTYPADFIYENVMIGFNVVRAAYCTGVKKLMNLGSSCIYPKLAPQPIKEESLLTSELEPTNDAYAIAKISMIRLCTAYNKQYGTNYLSAMPTNLYGPEDNYDLTGSHVLPALIRKFHEAKMSHTDKVTLWGDGSPYREFMYSEDLAEAVLYLMKNKDAADLRNTAGDFINIGTGIDLSIKELAGIIKTIVYHGTRYRNCVVEWDTSKPNGTPRKLLDISRLKTLGFIPKFNLEEGIKVAYSHYLDSLSLKINTTLVD
jgi:GDP-L-fucose synthase